MGNIKSKRLAATAVAVDHRCRLLGIAVAASVADGRVTIRNGTAGGPILTDIDVPASSGLTSVQMPGALLANSGLHVTLTGVVSATLFYEG